ncbi:MAG: DUF1080 domain-containing protein [Dysgonamonadaceae bacterium]|jgi:hypothetical protein|nr:DUF1080 domain-containing protein [Dysgonamonadaceae bacterium]
MKKIVFSLSVFVIAGMIASCSGNKKEAAPAEEAPAQTVEIVVPEKIIGADTIPAYTIMERPQVDLSKFKTDADGYIVLFDGTSLEGWRGYNKDTVPGKWTIEDGAIKFTGAGTGEAQSIDGGDLIFAHKFKNFELSIDWKVAKGSNSGIIYLAQEIKDQHIYISAPESQILDNENHLDAKLGKDGNRKSSSLYDMIPAKPQNSKPFGEWNNTTITVFKGTVLHAQNGENVLEYHLWTPEWTELLQASKFSLDKWPLAFDLLNNCGGENHEGYFGLQDHQDDVWFKNIRIKILD